MTGEPSSSRAESGPAKPYANNRRTSVLLREYMASLDAPKASLGSLRDALGDRGFGVLLFIFALPNLIPVNIPLLSAVLGAPLVLLAVQLTYGRHKPWFPHWLARRSVSRQNFEAVVQRSGLRHLHHRARHGGLAVLVGFAVGAFSLVVAGTVVIGLLHAFFLLLSSLAG
jgi:hypothetical protein